jgi:hypothetical protein
MIYPTISYRKETYIVLRISVVRDDGDDGVVDEEAEGQHATEAAECSLVHGHVLGRADLLEVDVDAPHGRVVSYNADQKHDGHSAWE